MKVVPGIIHTSQINYFYIQIFSWGNAILLCRWAVKGHGLITDPYLYGLIGYWFLGYSIFVGFEYDWYGRLILEVYLDYYYLDEKFAEGTV